MPRNAPALDRRFHALSDPTRRAIIERLARGETTVSELAKPHDMGLPAISKHIRVLEEAGMVRRWRAGRAYRCRLEPRALEPTEDWLKTTRLQWERMLDRLESMFEEDKEIEEHGHRSRR